MPVSAIASTCNVQKLQKGATNTIFKGNLGCIHIMEKKTKFLIASGSAVVLLAMASFFFLGQRDTETSTLGPVLTENGFVELRPPSNLYEPGTWVEVLQQSPLNLGIVCGPLDALGLGDSEGVKVSNSIELSFQSQLKPEFSVDAETIKSWQVNLSLGAVRSVNFNLSNIKLMELPDTAVFGGFKNRSQDCDDAIKFRLGNANPVSMVKSVLVADVEYLVDFEGSIDAEAKGEAAKLLAANLGAKIEHGQSNNTRIIGQQLVWGIRDDVALAKFGYELSSTGSANSDRSILTGKGPITDTDNSQQVRRSFSSEHNFISFDVSPLKQSSSMACWATVYTMMKSWKDQKQWTVARALAELDPQYLDFYVQDSGLPGGSELNFIRDVGMRAQPPANYSLTGFREMLTVSGPLWITLGDGINSHALLLVGIYGTSGEETLEAYRAATFEFIDPLTGTFIYRPALDFMQEFEREAAVIVNASADGIPLRWQILHWPSNS